MIDFRGLTGIIKSKTVSDEVIQKLNAITQGQPGQDVGPDLDVDNSFFGDEDPIKGDNTMLEKWKE